MAADSEYAMTALQRRARACARNSVRSSAHQAARVVLSLSLSISFTDLEHTVPPDSNSLVHKCNDTVVKEHKISRYKIG